MPELSSHYFLTGWYQGGSLGGLFPNVSHLLASRWSCHRGVCDDRIWKHLGNRHQGRQTRSFKVSRMTARITGRVCVVSPIYNFVIAHARLEINNYVDYSSREMPAYNVVYEPGLSGVPSFLTAGASLLIGALLSLLVIRGMS